MQESLATWLETNLASFLSQLRNDFSEDQEWVMPVVEDFALVVAIRDLTDDCYGVFTIAKPNTPRYRVIGLLTEATE